MSTEPIRLGVLGLGRAFTLMLPTFLGDRRVALRAAFDPRASACAQFEDIFGGTAHRSPESLCANPTVEWIYVATPHQMHAEHVALAAAHGKSVLVEKPMALTLDDATRMIEACERAGVSLIVGHSHSFNAPVLQARQLIDTGALGEVRLVHAMQYTDFLYRPRRSEELDTARGGGAVFSQAAHQIDIVRLLAGGLVSQVRARTGAWDASRPTEGAFSALLDFQNGAFASVTYNGYGFYDTDVLMEGLGEMGLPKDTDAHRLTRARLASVIDEAAEAAMKAERNFGGSQFVLPSVRVPDACQHFGPVIVSGDRGDLRLTPRGVELTDAQGTRFLAVDLPPVPRAEVIDELWRVAREDQPPVHGGAWSRATLEVCLAILESGRQGVAIMPTHQVAYPMPSRPDA